MIMHLMILKIIKVTVTGGIQRIVNTEMMKKKELSQVAKKKLQLNWEKVLE